MKFTLKPHPLSPPRTDFIVKVGASRRANGHYLVLTFYVYGDFDAITWHAPEAVGRAEELWKHSCFEAFIGGVGAADYAEINLAPGRKWASYAFDHYREGMRQAFDIKIARMDFYKRDLSVKRVEMQVLLELPGRFADISWQIGLSTIIEETDGTKSYWALAHAPGPPDFHNRDCWTARLPAPDPS